MIQKSAADFDAWDFDTKCDLASLKSDIDK